MPGFDEMRDEIRMKYKMKCKMKYGETDAHEAGHQC